MIENKRGRILSIITSVPVILLSIIIFVNYILVINEDMNEYNRIHIREAADENAYLISEKLTNAQNYLDSIAVVISQYEPINDPYVLDFLNTQEVKTGYSDLNVITPEGYEYLHDGSIVNSYKEEYFKRSVFGNRVVVERRNDNDTDYDVIISVPIIRNMSTVGVLKCKYPKEKLLDIFATELFDGNAIISVIAKDGTSIFGKGIDKINNTIREDRKSLVLAEGVLESDVLKDMSNGDSKLTYYSVNGKKYNLRYIPIDGTEWYLALSIPYESVDLKKNQILKEAVVLEIKFFVIILLVVGFLIYYIKLNNKKYAEMFGKVELNKQRYKTAMEHSDCAIWEYDAVTKASVLLGEVQTQFCFDDVKNNIFEEMISKGIVHPDCDDEYRNMFYELQNGEETAECVIKVKNSIGKFMWMKLSYKAVFDVGGNFIKAIGSSEDATDIVLAERKFEQDKQARFALTDDTIITYDINVSQNMVIGSKANDKNSLERSLKENYSDLIEEAANKACTKEAATKIRTVFSIDNLLNKFKSGDSLVTVEYQRVFGDEQICWVRAAVNLFKDHYSDDVLAFVRVIDIERKKEAVFNLKEKTEQDKLTGAYNKNAAIERIKATLQMEDCTSYAIYDVDVDNFKNVNDILGHIFGDRVIVETATVLKESVRTNDFIGRIDGDEFVVFLKNVRSKEDVSEKAEKLIKCLSNTYQRGEKFVSVSCSIGIVYDKNNHEKSEIIMKRASEALTKAKQQGKSRYSY